MDGITVSDYRPGQLIYQQGDSGESVFYILTGRVKLTVVSKFGKQAVIGVLGAGSFLGEGCLRGQPHTATATAMGKAWIERLDKATMARVLGENLAFSPGSFFASISSPATSALRRIWCTRS